MDSESNVRQTRGNMMRSGSNNDDESLSLSDCYSDSKSLPDLSTYDGASALNTAVLQLTSELEAANAEVDRLMLENMALQKQLDKSNGQISVLKQVCYAPASAKKSNTLKKRILKILTPEQSEQSNQGIDLNDTVKDLLTDPNIDNQKQETKEDVTDSSTLHTTSTQTEDGPEKQQQQVTDKMLSIQNPSKPNNENIIKETTRQENRTKRIYIFGGANCAGLSHQLQESRSDTRTGKNKYEITSYVTSGGTAEEIGKATKLYSYEKNDKIILSFGQHDSNPTKMILEIGYILNKLKDFEVLLLSARNSQYLNDSKISDTLKLICNNRPGCTFIDLNCKSYYGGQWKSACSTINECVDQLDYDREYLTYNKNNKNLKNHKVNKQITPKQKQNHIKKGTIPYYFRKVNTNKIDETKKTPKTTRIQNCSQKGTIPYYFRTVAKKQTSTTNESNKSIRVTHTSPCNQLFRDQ